MSDQIGTPRLDTFGLAASQDPYPALHLLRARTPVSWNDDEQAWLLARHDDVSAIIADRRFLVADISTTLAKLADASQRDFDDLIGLMRMVLFLRNPPAHGAERRFLARVMGMWPLASYAPVIAKIADDLLHAAKARGGLDLVTDYADLLPPLVMAHMFGLERQTALDLVALAGDITMVFDRGRSLRFYTAMNAKAALARQTMLAVLQRRRADPRDDALSRMIALNDAEFGLSDLDLATRAFFLFLAGVETTAALIGSSLRALLLHPGEHARLAAGDITPAAAFDELARWCSPVQQVTRIATSAVDIAGHAITAGQRVVLLVGAANHDPAAYPDPDRLVLGRPGPPNLAFGAGLHHCIGMGLARLETCIAVERSLALPNLRLVSETADWMGHRTQRRLIRLPVATG